jgi:hypothetical protein
VYTGLSTPRDIATATASKRGKVKLAKVDELKSIRLALATIHHHTAATEELLLESGGSKQYNMHTQLSYYH